MEQVALELESAADRRKPGYLQNPLANDTSVLYPA
jgi:hypothetical protein